MNVTVARDGKRHRLEFERGKPQNRVIEVVDGVEVSPARVIGETTKRGTKRITWPTRIFGTIEYHDRHPRQARLRELSFPQQRRQNPSHRPAHRQGRRFAFAGGVKGFVEYINRAKTVLHPTS